MIKTESFAVLQLRTMRVAIIQMPYCAPIIGCILVRPRNIVLRSPRETRSILRNRHRGTRIITRDVDPISEYLTHRDTVGSS
jgi:hypothetical protein